MSSIFTTELYAIILFTLRKLLPYPSSSFVIFTLKILSLLRSLYTIHSLVCEIQECLFRLDVGKKSICFCCVPSHAGTTDNERVDSLVNSASILGCHRFTKVPTYDYFHSFRSFLFSRWQSFWSDLSNNKLCAVKPSISPWLDPCHKNRWWETALTRLRISHTNLTHSYLMTHSTPTLCMTCNIPLCTPHSAFLSVTLLHELQLFFTWLIYFDLLIRYSYIIATFPQHNFLPITNTHPSFDLILWL